MEVNYEEKLSYHYRPKHGWINDPNGLVYFKGYYHIFYQHAPHYEIPWQESMHWGHTRTKDLLEFEELPVALYPSEWYDEKGCYSGTAIVKDDVLYLFYASIRKDEGCDHKTQTISVAYSRDGVHFEKYDKNPVIGRYPSDGGPDFRDPAMCCINGKYYCVIASGSKEIEKARLLLYSSDDMLSWEYLGIISEWDGCKYAECPSFMRSAQASEVFGKDTYLLTTSVCPLRSEHYFSIMYGDFEDGRFTPRLSGEVDKGPDQYAGQVFTDCKGRNLLISWIPGWRYSGYYRRDIGCMSVPREIFIRDGRICGYPIEELRHLLRDEDPAVTRTDNGFIIERQGREPVIYESNEKLRELKILRDAYILEVFVNGGEEIYSVLL